MERFVGKIAVVTGTGRGIGEAITKELVKLGITVVGLEKNENNLQVLTTEISQDKKTYPGEFYPLQCDISKETEVYDMFQNIDANIGPISILINNAGACSSNDKDLQSVNGEDFNITFNTNVKGLLLCSKAAINSMTENSSLGGHIININSMLGHPGNKMDTCNLYAASKHTARVLSDALRREVTKYKLNIKISTISPGLVNTTFPREAGLKIDNKKEEEILSPKDIAEACISILSTSPKVLISELTIVSIHAEE